MYILLDKPFDVFRQHMDRFQPIQTRTVQLWWSLCKMLRHSMITDKTGNNSLVAKGPKDRSFPDVGYECLFFIASNCKILKASFSRY